MRARWLVVRRLCLLVLPILISVSLAIWQTQFRDGWLEMAFSSWLFWIAALAWLVLVFAAIRIHRAWWLLITAPFVLWPVIASLLLLVICLGGDCF